MKYWYFILFSCALYAQKDSIYFIDEIKIYGDFSPRINAGYQIQIISDSIINKRQQSLGNLLQNQANLYFKQNGNGMVSSISLRGSGASSTGIYWNGIAINSTLNGQTDFNTISANGYNKIEIRKGAGSTLFGSGAIGGAINLSDKVTFLSDRKANLSIGHGSFNTRNIALNTKLSTSKIYTKIAINGEQSNNDYPYIDSDISNDNGAYKNYHLKGIFAYKINSNNKLQIHSTYSNNDREFSRTLVASNNSKYKNEDIRLLLNWKNKGLKYNSSFKLAYLLEYYKFYLNKNTSSYSYGKTNNYISRYNFNYFINSKSKIRIGVENKFITGNGSDLQNKTRNNFELYTLLHKQPSKKLIYNLSLRKNFSSTHKAPIIYAIDAKYSISNKFDVKGNFSTNYKLPTFNDLFWVASGNEKLLPEKNNSSELSFSYKNNKTKVTLTSYFTNSKDLIKWRPVSGTFWQPFNIQKVESVGLEADFSIKKEIKNHQFQFQALYAYTKAKDKLTNKQLIYVPLHKANTSLNYNYKQWSANINQQYNGKVYTTTSNTKTVTDFWLTNLSINKTFLTKKLNIGTSINNIFNTKYESVAYRPMPGLNYTIQLTYNY